MGLHASLKAMNGTVHRPLACFVQKLPWRNPIQEVQYLANCSVRYFFELISFSQFEREQNVSDTRPLQQCHALRHGVSLYPCALLGVLTQV